jgi:hypothetical protein
VEFETDSGNVRKADAGIMTVLARKGSRFSPSPVMMSCLTHHRLPGPDHIGDDGHKARGETARGNARVTVAGDADRSFAYVDDAHLASSAARCL